MSAGTAWVRGRPTGTRSHAPVRSQGRLRRGAVAAADPVLHVAEATGVVGFPGVAGHEHTVGARWKDWGGTTVGRFEITARELLVATPAAPLSSSKRSLRRWQTMPNNTA